MEAKKRPLGRAIPLTEEQLNTESLPSDLNRAELEVDAQEMSPLIAALLQSKSEE